jgi:predicted AlkP superfamily phosphohydrolase/phosphomutase
MQPLVEKGWMPNLKDLMAQGMWGDLLSTIPYITCPAWIALSTGRNPGWIGFFGFNNIEPSSYKMRYYFYGPDRELPELWDILGERGLSSGVMNNPIIRDPRPINGYMVPGFLADEHTFTTYPEDVKKDLDRAAGGYQIEVIGFSLQEPLKLVKDCDKLLRKRYLSMRALLAERPTDFFLGVFHLADRICHSALNRTGLPIEPDGDELSAAVAGFFSRLDGYIGALVEEFVRESDLFALVSDHGFAPCPNGIDLNTWLTKKGYLSAEAPARLPAQVVNKRKLAAALNRVGLYKPAMKYTPRFLRRMVPEGDGGGSRVSIIDAIEAGKVDWEKTLAVAMPNHCIYLNSADRPQGHIREGSEREAFMEGLCLELLEIEDPETGEKPIAAVHRREDIYEGPRLKNAPDLIVETVEGWNTKAALDAEGRLTVRGEMADHRREGIFLLMGEGIEAAAERVARIEDIAPTVLSFMEVSDRPPMDGDPLL